MKKYTVKHLITSALLSLTALVVGYALLSLPFRLMDWLDRSPLEHEALLWTRAQGERLTHVFEVGHWDWPESRETNDRTLDFFRRACAAPEKPAEE